MIFLAEITTDGGMNFGSDYNYARFKQWLKENPLKKLRIEEVKPKRSLSQNALYWKYLEYIERETGNNADYLHEYFKRTLLPPQFITVLGKEIKIPGSTADLTKDEFSHYLDKISAETNVPIPNTKAYNDWLNTIPDADEEFVSPLQINSLTK